MEKIILITGASSGIGEATARYLSSKGYQLVLVARRKEKLMSLVKELPNKAFWYSYDLSNVENIENIFIYCKEQSLKLDGLVHSAGIGETSPIKAFDVEKMQELMNINYFSFIELGKYFSNKKYSNNDSSIVAISSISAIYCQKAMCVYSASKVALNVAVKIMSKEFIKRGIRANAIMPAFVDTDMVKNTESYIDVSGNIASSQPLGIVETIQVAYLIEYLLSKKSKYVTGAEIPIPAG